MKITRQQLRKIIKEGLAEANWITKGWDAVVDTGEAVVDAARSKAIEEIINMLYGPIVDRINEYNYSNGVCDSYNCDGTHWADLITSQLKNHELIEKANVTDITLQLPGAIKLVVGNGQPKPGTVMSDVMDVLDQFSPETLVTEEVDLNNLFSSVLHVLQKHGLAEH